jgi:predicted nucleotidyltransferase component of viral defense system
MENGEKFQLKYKRVLELLPDVAECAGQNLILVGGTALALFHLKHRVSIDLDFVPVAGSDIKLKEALKGCLAKRGYDTARAAYSNQFVVRFEDTSIKVEVFVSDYTISKAEKHVFGNTTVLVASMEDIFEMKLRSYRERLEARDLFDIISILRAKGAIGENTAGSRIIARLLHESGPPRNADTLGDILLSKKDYQFFTEVMEDASKTGG